MLKDAEDFADFVVHELTHARQAQVMQANGWSFKTRGVHRDKGWYTAISEAAPNYLGVAVPERVWPRGPRTKADVTLTEVEMTHWPRSLRDLARANDPRFVSDHKPVGGDPGKPDTSVRKPTRGDVRKAKAAKVEPPRKEGF